MRLDFCEIESKISLPFHSRPTMYTFDASGSFRVDEPQETYIYNIEPIGDEIVAISSDNCLRLISPTSLHGPALKVIPKVHLEVTCLKALDGQNAIVCTAGRDGRVNIWDIRGNIQIAELKTGMSPSFRCLPFLLSLIFLRWSSNSLSANEDETSSKAFY
jgi:WD40 repeat protein